MVTVATCVFPRVVVRGPAVARLALHAEEGQVAGATALLEVEAYCGLFLVSVHGEHGRVQVENHGAERCRVSDQPLAELVVQGQEIRHPRLGEAAEEAAQALGIETLPANR